MIRLSLVSLLLALLAGCPDNPYKASSWTKKLGTREHERAVQELEQLGDPSAIPDLGQSWEDNGRQGRDLQAIISLARPLTKAEALAKHYTDYIDTGREASWDAALPILKKAISLVVADDSNQRNVEYAAKSADAIGESKHPDGIEALVELADKPPTKKLFNAQVAAIRAIGRFGDTPARAKAQAALVKIIDRDPPPHSRTIRDKDPQRQKEMRRAADEKYGMFLGISGAAINALGELRVDTASKTLITSLYRTPELASQLRQALVATGPVAKEELRKVLTGQQKDVEDLFAKKTLIHPRGLGWYCGDAGELTAEKCAEVSLRDFYAALILGDFYDPKSSAELLTALKKPPLPFAFIDDAPGPTQHSAIFDALRKIGPADAAATVRAMWMPKTGKGGRDEGPDLGTQILAIGAYPFLTRDASGVKDLGAIAAENKADAMLRRAAAESFARLSRDVRDIEILEDLAKKYYTASEEKRKEADGKPKKDADEADKKLAIEKKKVDDAKLASYSASKDGTKTTAAIRAAADAAKKAEDDFKKAKAEHRQAVTPYKILDDRAKELFGFGRLFQIHISRIEIALRCKDDLECYAKSLTFTPETSVANLKTYIKGVDKWEASDKLALLEGNIERAMLEIGKKGAAASKYTDLLLDHAKNDNRLIRQSIMLALPKIAALPCETCVSKLDAAIKAGEGKTQLVQLNMETMMLRNYFAAGKRVAK
jgi:hypothetical protein